MTPQNGHEAAIHGIKQGIYTVGYRAECACGWLGTDTKRVGQAGTEVAEHLKELAPKPKEKSP